MYACMQIYNTNMQVYMFANIQVWKYARLWVYKCVMCKFASVKAWGMQVCKKKGYKQSFATWVCKYASV